MGKAHWYYQYKSWSPRSLSRKSLLWCVVCIRLRGIHLLQGPANGINSKGLGTGKKYPPRREKRKKMKSELLGYDSWLTSSRSLLTSFLSRFCLEGGSNLRILPSPCHYKPCRVPCILLHTRIYIYIHSTQSGVWTSTALRSSGPSQSPLFRNTFLSWSFFFPFIDL